jgi:hypothetical protein
MKHGLLKQTNKQTKQNKKKKGKVLKNPIQFQSLDRGQLTIR